MSRSAPGGVLGVTAGLAGGVLGVTAGLAGGVLGVTAGLAEVVVGTHPLLGAKQDPTTLGGVTVSLGVLVLVLATLVDRDGDAKLAAGSLLVVVAAVGTTTAGVAWLPAGLLAAGTGLSAWHGVPSPGRVVAEHWGDVLVVTLAVVPLAFGIVAGGGVGLVGVVGSIAILGALRLRRRSRPGATGLLIAGAVPIAVLAWWTMVLPLTAVLTIAIGVPVVRRI